jgi:predicted lipid-binding transport protein (Tim44 family)
MQSSRFRHIFLLLFSLCVGLSVVIEDAEAKRLGGGRSIGRQSSNVTQREAPAPQGSPSQQASRPAQGQQGAAAPAPQQPSRNRWLGPLAGLAAGIGIASLLSHFGMGGALAEAMGSMLMIGLLVLAGFFIYRMLKGANAKNGQEPNIPPGMRPAYAKPSPLDEPPARRDYAQPSYDNTVTPLRREAFGAAPEVSGPVSVTGEPLAPLPSSVSSTATWTVPADFDVEGFLRNAKVYFVRLQAAWDAADLADIREFTTPEMFAEIKMDLSERGDAKNVTDVVKVDAQLLGIEEQGSVALASVRFTGTMREAEGAPAEPFDEVWNLVKPLKGKEGWLLGGIQQG